VTPVIEIEDLVVSYGTLAAVDRLTLNVPSGSITALVGPNGAGKSSVLSVCEGLRRPATGRVRVLGLDPIRDRRELLPRIGVQLQNGGVWSTARAVEMLSHIASLHAHPLPVGLLVDRLGLASCGRTPYRRLSGGQQQRLGLAMAVVGRPELLLLDEPTAGMDPAVRRDTWELLRELRTAGVSVALTTHYLEEAERLGDLIHVIDHGRLVASGSPGELTGNDRASVRLTLREALPTDAAATLTRHLLPLHTVVRIIDTHSLSVTAESESALVGPVAAWCASLGLVPDQITHGAATLEDVFFAVTAGIRDSR
jgi:ABC-2 type transport system ATP-binding protein